MTLNPTRLARFSDWTQTLTPRPLPRTVVPVPGEYHLDYVRRLAAANHLEFLELCKVVDDHASSGDGRHRWRERRQERLAAVAGQQPDRIARLCWPEPGTYLRDPEAFRRGLRPACRRCTARHHTAGPIFCQLPDHVTVCRRHRLWIGPDTRTISEQADLATFPEYLTAQRHHQRLYRQHRHATAAAWRQVENELHRQLYHHRPTHSQRRRLAHFATEGRPGDHLHRPGVAVALYPDLVRLTSRLLATTPNTDSPREDHRSRWTR